MGLLGLPLELLAFIVRGMELRDVVALGGACRGTRWVLGEPLRALALQVVRDPCEVSTYVAGSPLVRSVLDIVWNRYGAYMAATGLYETMRPDDPVVRNVVRYTPGALLRNVSLAGVYHVRDTQPALWAAEVESGYTAHLRFTRDPAVLSTFAGFYCRPGKTARAIASNVQPAMRSDATAAVITRLVVPRLGGAKRRNTAKHLFENLYDFESIARVIETFGVTVYFAFSHIVTTPEVWWTLAEAYPLTAKEQGRLLDRHRIHTSHLFSRPLAFFHAILVDREYDTLEAMQASLYLPLGANRRIGIEWCTWLR